MGEPSISGHSSEGRWQARVVIDEADLCFRVEMRTVPAADRSPFQHPAQAGAAFPNYQAAQSALRAAGFHELARESDGSSESDWVFERDLHSTVVSAAGPCLLDWPQERS